MNCPRCKESMKLRDDYPNCYKCEVCKLDYMSHIIEFWLDFDTYITLFLERNKTKIWKRNKEDSVIIKYLLPPDISAEQLEKVMVLL